MPEEKIETKEVDNSVQVVEEAKKKIQAAIEGQTQLKQQIEKNTSQDILRPPAEGWQKVEKDKYEIELYDEVTDEHTGDIKGYKKFYSEQPIIIEAASVAELKEHQARYEFCHQKMKIIRCLTKGAKQNTVKTSQKPISQESQTVSKQECNKSKPQYYRIGNIEIKNDNGKIYQKQWVQLSPAEVSNLRVINDKNNAIVNLTGKHFEMLKWILVENSEEDDTTNLEENLK